VKVLPSPLERGMLFSQIFGVSKEKVSGTPFLKSKPPVRRISPLLWRGVGGEAQTFHEKVLPFPR
jgi:hypothetical protein